MAKMTVSVVKGHGSMAHNNREFYAKNVKQEHTKDNIIYKQEPLQDAYRKLFQNEVDRFNVGKKPCRQIKNYLEHIRQSKNGEKPFYEIVVQVGDMHSCPCGSEEGKVSAEILDRYMRDFQRRNPNLYVFNAVLHLDEATPHLHIDYIPVARGYQKGMQVRNSLDKALKQQGIDGKADKRENSNHNWQESEKDRLEDIMREYGLERKPESGLHRKHQSVEQYKATAEQVHNEVKKMPKQIETAPMMLNKTRVTVDVEDLAELEKRAKLSLVHEKASRNLEKQLSEKLLVLEQTLRQAEQERNQALKMKQDYEKLYKSQRNLIPAYNAAVTDNKQLKQEIAVLQKEKVSLQIQIDNLKQTMEDRIAEAVKPLMEKIEELTERLQNICKAFACAVKAVGMLKYDEVHEYKAELSHKQEELVDGIAEYAMGWIKEQGSPDIATELIEDIDNNVGISEGIKYYLTPEYKNIIYYKGSQGYGFYSSKVEGAEFLGKKGDYESLKAKFPTATFSDPHGHVPEISGQAIHR